MNQTRNKTVLITGASLGIGLEFARIFAREGYSLVLVARSAAKLQELARELAPANVVVLVRDLSLPGVAQEIFDEMNREKIQVDILVNNAGFGDYGFFHEAKLERQIQMIDLNVRTLTELTYLFGRQMIARKEGKVLNVASTAAFQPGPLMAVYYATKHFVLAFSEAIANEWKPFGVTVTALCPGPTASGFQDAAGMGESKLAKGWKMPSSATVAQYGYEAMMRGQVVAVEGWMNKVASTLVQFLPRAWVIRIVRMIQDRI